MVSVYLENKYVYRVSVYSWTWLCIQGVCIFINMTMYAGSVYSWMTMYTGCLYIYEWLCIQGVCIFMNDYVYRVYMVEDMNIYKHIIQGVYI